MPAQVVSGLAGASLFVSGSVMQFQQWSRSFAQRPNTLFTLDHDVYMTGEVCRGCGAGIGYIDMTSRHLLKCHSLPYPGRRQSEARVLTGRTCT